MSKLYEKFLSEAYIKNMEEAESILDEIVSYIEELGYRVKDTKISQKPDDYFDSRTAYYAQIELMDEMPYDEVFEEVLVKHLRKEYDIIDPELFWLTNISLELGNGKNVE